MKQYVFALALVLCLPLNSLAYTYTVNYNHSPSEQVAGSHLYVEAHDMTYVGEDAAWFGDVTLWFPVQSLMISSDYADNPSHLIDVAYTLRMYENLVVDQLDTGPSARSEVDASFVFINSGGGDPLIYADRLTLQTGTLQLMTDTVYSTGGFIEVVILGILGESTIGYELTLDIATADAAPTPIPGAVWLLGSGLAGLMALRRRSA